MSVGSPEFCRLEYWNPVKQEWEMGHRGVNLLHPERYPERLWENKKNQKIGRVTVFAPGSITEIDRVICPRDPAAALPKCSVCDEHHPEPHDGSCLL